MKAANYSKDASTVCAEADAIRAIVWQMRAQWQCNDITKDEAEVLIATLYGLEVLAEGHAKNAQRLLEEAERLELEQ